MSKLTTEELDKAQLGRVLHERPVRISCAVCHGTGVYLVEYGLAGAIWTAYERCFVCKGVDGFHR